RVFTDRLRWRSFEPRDVVSIEQLVCELFRRIVVVFHLPCRDLSSRIDLESPCPLHCIGKRFSPNDDHAVTLAILMETQPPIRQAVCRLHLYSFPCSRMNWIDDHADGVVVLVLRPALNARMTAIWRLRNSVPLPEQPRARTSIPILLDVH